MRGSYKIDFSHWKRVLGLKQDNLTSKQRKKLEFLKFLKSLAPHQADLYWEERGNEIRKTYDLDSLEQIAHEKWNNIKPTWRNTKIPDKILFFEMIDKEQEKLINNKDF